MIGPEQEQLQDGSGDFADSVLLELSDVERNLFGLVRLARGAGAGTASAIALLFADGELVGKQAQAGLDAEISSWDLAEADGVRLGTVEPLARWTASFEGSGGSFELEATATSEPIDLTEPATAAVARGAGVSRYEQLLAIRGEARVNGSSRTLDGVGRRVHSWGAPGPPRGGLLRSLFAVSEEEGLTVTAVRPAGSEGHGAELVGAHLSAAGSPPAPFEDARISTIYDGSGAIRRAGLELYMPGDEYPRRVSGEARAATVVEAGDVRLAVSFFRWSVQGAPGQGSYRVVSPA
jgi:hypothetical protein